MCNQNSSTLHPFANSAGEILRGLLRRPERLPEFRVKNDLPTETDVYERAHR